MIWKKKISACCLAVSLALCAVPVSAAEKMANGVEIAVMVFNPDDAQTKTFHNYMQDYLGEAFGAKFYYSDAVAGVEAEKAFIEQIHELGVEGVIGNVSEETMELCEEYGIYYVYGANTVSDEVFERTKENEHFLGTISASLEEEQEVGRDMAAFFAEDEGKDSHGYIICTGGDSVLHRTRSAAMIQTLADSYGFTLEAPAEELAAAEEILELDTGGRVKITLIPGYPVATPLEENVREVASQGGYDTVMVVLSADYIIDGVRDAEAAAQTDIRVGAVDCFTEEAQNLFRGTENSGEQELNYLAGTVGGMIAPAFVALCNAYTGNLDTVRDDGHAFRLYRSYWTARSADEFEELYNRSVSLYDNVYSAVDLMQVISVFQPEADFESFKAFTEGSAVLADGN